MMTSSSYSLLCGLPRGDSEIVYCEDTSEASLWKSALISVAEHEPSFKELTPSGFQSELSV